MKRTVKDPEVISTCPECGNQIDLDMCYCGIDKKSHNYVDDHNFVPFGCVCGYGEKKPDPVVFFVTTIDMKPLKVFGNQKYLDYVLPLYGNDLESLHYSSRTWLWLPTYKEAEDFVLNNEGDLSEGGSNRWVCVEGVRPIYIETNPEPQVFFEFSGDWEHGGNYQKIKGWPEPVDKYFEKNHLVRMIADIG